MIFCVGCRWSRAQILSGLYAICTQHIQIKSKSHSPFPWASSFMVQTGENTDLSADFPTQSSRKKPGSADQSLGRSVRFDCGGAAWVLNPGTKNLFWNVGTWHELNYITWFTHEIDINWKLLPWLKNWNSILPHLAEKVMFQLYYSMAVT